MSQSAVRIAAPPSPPDAATDLPVVIVGNGPVGMRLVRDLLDRSPSIRIVIYGEEQHEPYDRVQLSAWLAGDVDRDALVNPLAANPGGQVEQRIGYRVQSIDRADRVVVDSTGRRQPYAKLVLATGSSPFVPGIPGIDLAGVYTFRDLDDAARLMARRVRSHRTVVLGGGLLGLESARGMQPGNTRVTVVEHADRLLGRQLDEAGSAQLRQAIEALGIDVVIGDGVAEIRGDTRVASVRLRSGRELACDTLVVATGIRPNTGLARDARLAFDRGIQVDDRMRTSDPDIYAIGECAEHRGSVYGLVGPGFEQAGVAAADIVGVETRYAGSLAASRLKVVGTPVFSIGPVGAGEDPHFGRAHVFQDSEAGIYRKVLVHRHRIVGVIGIGRWDESLRLQGQVGRTRPVWPWQILRFRHTGTLWPVEDSQHVAAWPAGETVCQCTAVTRGTISDAITGGAATCEAVTRATGAGSVCGSCRPLIHELVGAPQPAAPAPLHRTLLFGAGIGVLGSLLFLFGPGLPYADSVQQAWSWDFLWRDGLVKQITGFSVLALFAIGLLLSLRKRVRRLDRLGGFDGWRLAHVILGILVIVVLGLHTGFRPGHGLNFMLLLSFSVMLLLGALSSGVIALEHRIGGALATRLRRRSIWLHILTFWPVPALLGWHIFKSYWY